MLAPRRGRRVAPAFHRALGCLMLHLCLDRFLKADLPAAGTTLAPPSLCRPLPRGCREPIVVRARFLRYCLLFCREPRVCAPVPMLRTAQCYIDIGKFAQFLDDGVCGRI